MVETSSIIRNSTAKVVLVSGERFTLRETLLGEQVRLPSGAFASEVTPMKHGRFRLWQRKNDLPRVPIDIYAQQVDSLRRHGAANGLGRMAAQPAEFANTFKVIQNGLPFSGEIQSFFGRAVLHGTAEKTGGIRTALVSDIQSLEVKRRLPPPNPRKGIEIDEWSTPDPHATNESNTDRNESHLNTNTSKETDMSIKPTEDRVLVKPIEADSKTASGIYLPEASKEKPVKGQVIATGPGKRLENGKRAEMSVRKGDTVVYGKYAGTEVEIKGDKHLIIRESELLGVIEG